MARRSDKFARLGSHGGYTQALAAGKGFSGSERRTARDQAGGTRWNGDAGGMVTSAFARHQELIRNYLRYHPTAKVPKTGAVDAQELTGRKRLSDGEALRRQHRFVRDPAEDTLAQEARGREGDAVDPLAWEVRMATKYYQLLFKEYALADLSRFREDKVGLRWRTEKDVVSGKGQFECGELRCVERGDLHSYEINFRYKEAGTVKNELVKVRVCPQCARKLFWKKIKALQRQQEADRERTRKGVREASASASASSDKADEGGGREGREDALDGVVGQEARQGEGSGLGRSSDDLGKTAVHGYAPSISEGHDLVLRAVAAARGGAGASPASQGKRPKHSRWGDRLDASGGVGAAAGGQQDGVGERGEGSVEAGTGGDSAVRRAWAGEVERERTAEDEIDDYISSLLL